ncbi:hypothetical protein ACSVIJ_24195 [Pseudomonas sp. NCHU5208]|uniref:hypothetical protein n=1 Tax=unclassified Pseudomonas TaxID=196821 RepID=UPI003F98435E
MTKRLALIFALVSATAGLSLPASAREIIQCENIGRPPGYLTVESGISVSNCPTRRAVRFSTPYEGLAIEKPPELVTVEPRYVVTKVFKLGNTQTFQISPLVDGIIGCSFVPYDAYNYFTRPADASGCSVTPGSTSSNAIRYYQYMYVELARPAGQAGNLRVSINKNMTSPTLYYAIRTTSRLNGGTRTVMKTALTKSGSYQLADLAPDMVADARAGASFVFEVEMFMLSKSVSMYSIQATGQEMLKN